MKEIKTANYKKIANNYKRELALKLLDWHGGQGSNLYSVGSSWLAGHDVPNEVIDGAISELDDELQKRKRAANSFVSSQKEWAEFEEGLEELEFLKRVLKEEMQKEDLFNNEDDIDLNLLNN